MTFGARSSRTNRFMNHQNGQNAPLLSPANPAPAPANDKSWQGKEAQTKSAMDRSSVVESFATSRSMSSGAPLKFFRYDAVFFGSISLANRQCQEGPSPIRAMPPPAKNS